jgi:dipeptidyl aminopeptidase/acylaminoacyl peptidase
MEPIDDRASARTVTISCTAGNVVDGMINNWAEDGEPRQDLPEDAVEEFRITNASYKAEFGLATGGVVQVVTKSGTNQLRGTAFEYFRDKPLNAKGPQPPVPRVLHAEHGEPPGTVRQRPPEQCPVGELRPDSQRSPLDAGRARRAGELANRVAVNLQLPTPQGPRVDRLRSPWEFRRWAEGEAIMQHRIAGAIVVACTSHLAVASTVDAQVRAFRTDDHYRLKTAADVRLSPDGSMIAFVERYIDENRRNRSHIWLLTLADASLRRISAPDADDSSPRWSPDGRALAFLSGTRGPSETGFLPTAFGNAIAVAWLDRDATEIVAKYQVTNHPLAYQGSAEQIAWAPDGRAIAFISAEDGPEGPPGDPQVVTRYGYKSWSGMSDNRRWHIHVVTLADKKVRRLTDGPYQDHSIAWSPKGDEIAFISNHEPDPDRVHNYDIFAVRVSDKRVRQITTTKGCEYAPAWSPDGSTIAYLAGVRPLTTQESSAEDPHVWVIPAAGGTARQLATSLDRRVNGVAWAPDEPVIYFTVQDRGSVHLYRAGADGSNVRPVVSDRGSVSSFSIASRQTIAYGFQSVIAPAEVYLRTGTESARKVTRLNAELLAARSVSAPEAFEFASFDGTRVQAFLTPPLQREPGRRYPLVVNIHGGPHGQQGPGFVHKSQVYAGAGYAVLMVNYRGSSGYGQTFSDGTINDQNGGEFKDVIAGLDYILAKTPYLDPERVGVEGGSYGGQLTNWAITQTPRFKSAVPSASISNLLSHSYLIWAQDYPQVEWGGRFPWQGDLATLLWDRSPLAHVARVKTPTMFIHGELDQDVPIQEAEQMYIALKQVGVEAVLVRYPREGHGLREPAHVVDGIERSLAWHGRFLEPGRGTNPAGR